MSSLAFGGSQSQKSCAFRVFALWKSLSDVVNVFFQIAQAFAKDRETQFPSNSVIFSSIVDSIITTNNKGSICVIVVLHPHHLFFTYRSFFESF